MCSARLPNRPSAQGLGVKIITGDRDLLQLVGDDIIVNLPEGKLSDAKDYITDDDVIAKFGVPARAGGGLQGAGRRQIG